MNQPSPAQRERVRAKRAGEGWLAVLGRPVVTTGNSAPALTLPLHSAMGTSLSRLRRERVNDDRRKP